MQLHNQDNCLTKCSSLGSWNEGFMGKIEVRSHKQLGYIREEATTPALHAQ